MAVNDNYGDAGRQKGGMKDDATHYAQDMAARAKERGRSLFEQQKEAAARQMGTVADAFRSTAGRLQGEGQSQAGRYVNIAAERLESLGQQMRTKDMDALIGDAENLGRRAPGAFFAGSVVAGFLFARFLKSSSQRRHAASGGAQRTESEGWSQREAHLDPDRSLPSTSGMGAMGAETPFDSLGSTGRPIATEPTGTAGTSGTAGSASQSSPSGTNPGGSSYGNR